VKCKLYNYIIIYIYKCIKFVLPPGHVTRNFRENNGLRMSVPPDGLAKMHKMHELLKVTRSPDGFLMGPAGMCKIFHDIGFYGEKMGEDGRRWVKMGEWFGCVQS
jgi:hypothetical protein